MTSGARYHLVTTCFVSDLDLSLPFGSPKVVFDFKNWGRGLTSSSLAPRVLDFRKRGFSIVSYDLPILRDGLSSLPYFFF